MPAQQDPITEHLLYGWCRFYCVALTDQLLHSRIALEQYHKHSMHLETLVRCTPGYLTFEDIFPP